jgi:hypothetical protein
MIQIGVMRVMTLLVPLLLAAGVSADETGTISLRYDPAGGLNAGLVGLRAK